MIGVLVVENKFLVIKRSSRVRSPGMACFPGGGIEEGETQEQALVREMREELSIDIQPVRKVWESRLRAGWRLHWWAMTMTNPEQEIQPDPYEVEDFEWLPAEKVRVMSTLLSSNSDFFDALAAGEIKL